MTSYFHQVVLAFYPAAFSGNETIGCQCQLTSAKELSSDKVAVVGISYVRVNNRLYHHHHQQQHC